MMISYVFPGQGSQKVGMGKDLFDLYPDLSQKTDQILGYSIQDLCLNDPDQKINQTQYTQPALYVVNALSYLKKIQETNQRPSYLAGHSLGEYNALLAAEVFDFETGLRLVQKRGELMGQIKSGSMAAVIGLNEEKIKVILSENSLSSVDIANDNSPSQIVLSGPTEEIQRAKPIFESAGARMYIPLKVSGAFHSRYMTSVQEEFQKTLSQLKFSDPKIPVISNLEARPYTLEKIRDLLACQITHSVRWTETIQWLIENGTKEFCEIGPGNVLTGLIKNIQKEMKTVTV